MNKPAEKSKGRGGVRIPGPGKRIGRPVGSGDARNTKVWAHVGLTPAEWEYVRRWSDGNAGDCISEMIVRLRMMAPNGPRSVPANIKTGKERTR